MAEEKTLSTSAEEDIQGIDSIQYAYKNCEFCSGTGYVEIDDGGNFPRSQICGCVIENRRRHVSEVQLKKSFGGGQLNMTFGKYNPGTNKQNQQALQGCINYVKNWEAFKEEGIGFALQGEYGCGKTHLATATLIALVKRWSMADGTILKPYAISTPELFRMARKRFEDSKTEDVIERSMKASICLLDDLGAERHTKEEENMMSWVDEQLYTILDWRISNNLPTLYTTNKKVSELSRYLDPRVFRRLQTRTAAFWIVKEVPEMGKPDTRFADLLSGKTNSNQPTGEKA